MDTRSPFLSRVNPQAGDVPNLNWCFKDQFSLISLREKDKEIAVKVPEHKQTEQKATVFVH